MKKKTKDALDTGRVDRHTPFLMLLPAAAAVILVSVYPTLRTIGMSFFDKKLLSREEPFIGLDNYVQALTGSSSTLCNVYRSEVDQAAAGKRILPCTFSGALGYAAACGIFYLAQHYECEFQPDQFCIDKTGVDPDACQFSGQYGGVFWIFVHTAFDDHDRQCVVDLSVSDGHVYRRSADGAA